MGGYEFTFCIHEQGEMTLLSLSGSLFSFFPTLSYLVALGIPALSFKLNCISTHFPFGPSQSVQHWGRVS